MLKQSPLIDYEISIIKWLIWEPLRRNPQYQVEYRTLKEEFFLKDTLPFCKKWRLPHPIDPDWNFYYSKTKKRWQQQWPVKEDWLTAIDAKRAIQSLFFDIYPQSTFDHGAFIMPLDDWIVNGHYLKVWINLSCSRNQILKALDKELKEWRGKWKEFYKREIPGSKKAVFIESRDEKYLELHIDLEAYLNPKDKKKVSGYILPEIKQILRKQLSNYKEKETVSRFKPTYWDFCYFTYDLVESFKKELQKKKKLPRKYSEDHRKYLKVKGQQKEAAFEIEMAKSTVHEAFKKAEHRIKSFPLIEDMSFYKTDYSKRSKRKNQNKTFKNEHLTQSKGKKHRPEGAWQYNSESLEHIALTKVMNLIREAFNTTSSEESFFSYFYQKYEKRKLGKNRPSKETLLEFRERLLNR